jgi:hypothetical protein
MKPFIFSLSLLITLAESKNNTAVVKYHPKANGAPGKLLRKSIIGGTFKISKLSFL